MFRPPTTREVDAQKHTAVAIAERLEVFAVTPKREDRAFQQQQALDIVKTVLVLYASALERDRPVIATGLRGTVIGQIGVR